jgi:hypothetical protein
LRSSYWRCFASISDRISWHRTLSCSRTPVIYANRICKINCFSIFYMRPIVKKIIIVVLSYCRNDAFSQRFANLATALILESG